MNWKSSFVAIICTFFTFTSLSTEADTFGHASGKADNKIHFVCWVPYASGGGNAPAELNDHLTYINTTVFPQSGVYAYPYPCVPLVDAFFDDDLNNPTLYGVEYCRIFPLSQPGNRCVEADVKINNTTITADAQAAGKSVSAVKRFNWCHETGHSFGLNHTTGSNCLNTGLQTYQSYSSHHIQHLNNDL